MLAAGRRRPALQALAFALLAGAVAILVFGGYVGDGGWVGDAWLTRSWYATYPHVDFLDTVGHFLDLDSMSSRPANAVYRVALNEWFGADLSAWLAWQLASCVLMCLCVYLLLREVGLAYLDAVAVGLLLLVFPASLSLWFWSAVVHAPLAIALGCIGFVLALRAFGAAGARRRLLHAGSLGLFVLSILLYEVCLPVFLASVLLYALRAPRRQAVGRWLLDCLVLAPIALWVTSATDAQDQDLPGTVAHAGDMIAAMPAFLFGRLLPFDLARPLGFVLIAAVYLCAFAVLRRRAAEDPVRARLRALFALTGAGLVVVALGYAIYAPGLDYYSPLATGVGDRVNAVAGIGWVMALYALAAMLATLVVAALRQAPLYASLATAGLALALGLSWLAPIADESRSYVDARREGDRVLGVIERAVPDPQPGTAIWVFGQPVEITPGVPVFSNYWNMTGAVALLYHDHRIRGFVGLPGTRFECQADGLVPRQDPEYAPPPAAKLGRFGSRYGKTWFVNTVSGQFTNLESRSQCLATRDAYGRSPQLASGRD